MINEEAILIFDLALRMENKDLGICYISYF